MKNKLLFICLAMIVPMTLQAQLSGNYTINPTGSGATNYTTFTAAVAALTTSGIAGNVVFTVSDAIYTETITIGDITGTSASASVTFQSLSGNPGACYIKANAAPTAPSIGGAVNLVGSKYIRFRGVGLRTYLATPSAAVHIRYGTAPADHIRFDNCDLIADTVSAAGGRLYPILMSNTNGIDAGANLPARFITLNKCVLKGGCIGLGMVGTSGATSLDSLTVDSCQILKQNDFSVIGVNISNINFTRNTIDQMRSGTDIACYLISCFNYNISSNSFIATAGAAKSIWLDMGGISTAPATPSYVTNNFFIGGGSTNATLASLDGLKNVKFYHNTFRNVHDAANGPNFTGTTSIEFVNNAVQMGKGGEQMIAIPTITAGSCIVNYNTYFGNNKFYSAASGRVTTLATWQATPNAFDANSYFDSLGLEPASPVISSYNVGVHTGAITTGITKDIYGRTRCTPPTIGAYEAVPTVAQPGAFTASTANICSGQNNVAYTIPAVAGATSYTWSYTGTGATITGTGTSVTVSYASNATSGTLKVVANNSCNTSPSRDLAISVTTTPATPTITGGSSVCANSTLQLTSNPSTGGTWSSANTTTATVSSSGLVTGKAAGTVNITYTVGTTCPAVGTTSITVNPSPAVPTVTGTTSICINGTSQLTGNPTGGTWSSNNTNAATVSSSGLVTAAGTGTATISYTVGTGCTTSLATIVTINPLPAIPSVSGLSNVCTGATTTLTGNPTGGAWTSGTPANATISNAGVVSGIAAGTSVITYTITDVNNCSNSITTTMNVNATPVATTTAARPKTFCDGDSVVLQANTTTGLTYKWLNGTTALSNTASAHTAKTSGMYRVVITTASNCFDTSGTDTVVVKALPHPVITTTNGKDLSTTIAYSSYQWFKNAVLQSGATSRNYHATTPGSYTVLVDSNGCLAMSAPQVVTVGIGSVESNGAGIVLYPNPATSTIHIDAPVTVNVLVTGIDGKIVLQQTDATTIDIGNLATGMYIFRITDKDGTLLKIEKVIKTSF